MHQLPNANRQRVPECPAAPQPDEPDGLDGGDERMDRGAASNTAPASCLQGLQSKEDLAPPPGNIPSKHLSITIFRWWYLA